MSDIVGGKAISLVRSGGIVERLHARTFVLPGRPYTVTIGAGPVSERYRCTCPAIGRCYHGAAALLLLAQQRDAGERPVPTELRAIREELMKACPSVEDAVARLDALIGRW